MYRVVGVFFVWLGFFCFFFFAFLTYQNIFIFFIASVLVTRRQPHGTENSPDKTYASTVGTASSLNYFSMLTEKAP